jgi:hypothetical protein
MVLEHGHHHLIHSLDALNSLLSGLFEPRVVGLHHGIVPPTLSCGMYTLNHPWRQQRTGFTVGVRVRPYHREEKRL